MTSSAIRELLTVTEQPDVISFAGGLPAPEAFPLTEVRRVSDRILRDRGAQALQYGPTEGHRPLREAIAERVVSQGYSVTADHVLVTTGSQQALDLVGKVFLDPGDAVAVESPTYLATLQAWRAYGARYCGVESDQDGMDVDHLGALLPERPKLVYCVPNFQNPRGVTLSLARRKALVALVSHAGVPVVEDDPYGELRFGGEPLPSLLSLTMTSPGHDAPYGDTVISLGTFSKILAPGLRVGWVVAAREVIAQLTRAKQGTDLHTASLNQMIACEMLQSGFLAEHRKAIVGTYRERRDTMLAALAAHFPSGARWTHPEGGMFLWVELPERIDAAALLRRALERRVAFVPGQAFHADGRGANTLRLNFSNASPQQIREGIERLGRAVEDMLEERTPCPWVA
jgi:2-aminoadipate transaminase